MSKVKRVLRGQGGQLSTTREEDSVFFLLFFGRAQGNCPPNPIIPLSPLGHWTRCVMQRQCVTDEGMRMSKQALAPHLGGEMTASSGTARRRPSVSGEATGRPEAETAVEARL